ncbi:MAG: DUF3352 domain-containing protein [Cyanobacteria bacterium P01_A01_bin.45]
MRQKSIFKALIAVVIALLLTGLTGCDRFSTTSFRQVGENQSSENLGTAMLISKQAPFTVSILTSDMNWQKVAENADISKLKKSLFANTNIDYKKDIQPWLGKEMTLSVATPDIDSDFTNGRQPGYLMVLTSKDSQKSREFIEFYFSQRVLSGSQLNIERYKGIKIISDSLSPEKEKESILAVATLSDRFILFANYPEVLKEAINNIQAPSVSLSSYLPYQQAIEKLPKKPIAVAFLNLNQIAKWKGWKLKKLDYENQIISLSESPQGLLAQTSLIATEKTLPSAASVSQPVKALEYIPSTAGLVISGVDLSNLNQSNLAEFWQQTQLKISSKSKGILSEIFTGKNRLAKLSSLNNEVKLNSQEKLEQKYGLNLSEDIFSWVKGEYAFAILLSPGSNSVNWIFVTEKVSNTAQGVTHLDDIARKNGLIASPLNLGEQELSTWTKLETDNPKVQLAEVTKDFAVQAKIYGVHTNIENYEIFASSVETIAKVLTSEDNSIIRNRKFKDSIAKIPQPNQGYIYLDWEESKQQIENQLPILKLAEIIGKPFFDKLRSLTISSYENQDYVLNGGILFNLKAN